MLIAGDSSGYLIEALLELLKASPLDYGLRRIICCHHTRPELPHLPAVPWSLDFVFVQRRALVWCFGALRLTRGLRIGYLGEPAIESLGTVPWKDSSGLPALQNLILRHSFIPSPLPSRHELWLASNRHHH